MRIKSDLSPLARLMALTVVPYRMAIAPSVSPFLTLYLRVEDLCVLLEDLRLDEDADFRVDEVLEIDGLGGGLYA